MELFKLLGKIAIDGVDQAKKDIDDTHTSIQKLKKKVEEYEKTGLTTSESWKKATRDMQENTEESADGISGSLQAIGTAVTTYLAFEKIADFTQKCIDAAANMGAMESQFTQVFGDMGEQAATNLSAMADDTGIVENRLKGSYTQIAAFAKTTGMDTADALSLADRAMYAVADSAAFYDRSLEDTTNSLQSFLKGNYENDAALGLSCTETTRNAAANELYGKSFQDLSEAQKQLTLLQMVEDANALSGALGQASRESDTWTNQTGNLQQSWVDVCATLGENFLPLAVKVVGTISNIVSWLSEHETIATVLVIAIGALTVAITAFHVAQTLATAGITLATAATTAFGTVMAFVTSPITLVVAAIAALIAIIVILVKNWDVIKEKALEVWEKIKAVWGTVKDWFNEKVVEPIAGFFTGLWDGIKNGVVSAWTKIKDIFGGVKDWFNTKVVQPISNLFSNLGSGIQQAFKVPINWIISGINSFIRGINRIKIPDWVPVVGGKGFHISELPQLAKGGVLEEGQVGLLEGSGAEAVVPLENNAGWINKVARDMEVAIGGGDTSDKLQELIDSFEHLFEMLADYFADALENRDVVLDSGELVGALAVPMNERLGRLLARKERGR